MIQVFRIEHAITKIGPFQTDTEFTQYLATHTSGPRPCTDGLSLSRLPWCYKFGCLSVHTLKQWITVDDIALSEIVTKLTDLGFVLVEYLVEKTKCRVGRSETQLAFDPFCAHNDGLFEIYPLTKLLD